MKRPAVEEFKRLTSQPAHAWGMADSDVVALCDYILSLEDALRPFAEPHPMGDAYVQFSPDLIRAARAALQPKN